MTMRRFILIAALLLFTASCLYVPWRVRGPHGSSKVSYDLLWSAQPGVPKSLPADFSGFDRPGDFKAAWIRERATIDYGRLGLQFAALAALTTTALLLAKRSRQ